MKKFYFKPILFVCFLLANNLYAQISFTNPSSANFPVMQFSARAIVADFDEDRDADILYQTGGNGTAYQYARSNGSGNFSILSQASSPFAGLTIPDNTGTNYYIGDFDGDGDIDLWFGGTGSTGTFFKNNGASFALVSSSTFPSLAFPGRAIVGDFDRDRDVDILYQTGGDGSAYEYRRNNGDATFTLVPYASSPFGGLTLPDNTGTNHYLSDYDRDGDVDLWFAAAGSTGSYFVNNGGVFASANSGTFPVLAFAGRAIVGDFDSDSDGDILYQTGANGSAYEYRLNTGNASFTLVPIASSPFAGITIPDNTGTNHHLADYDADVDLDIWFGGSSASGTYLLQNAQPPIVVSSTPADNANNVALNQRIILNFNESVTAGAGNIYVRRMSDNLTVETIPANGPLVTGSGTSTININRAVLLAPNTSYYLNFDLTAFRDADNSSFGQYDHITHAVGPITDTGYLNFTTNATVLAVLLSSYTVTKVDNAVDVQWQTASEINSDYFVVEHSTDGINFTPLNTISSRSGAQGNNYLYKHLAPASGINYYRLVQYDKDGSSEVFATKSVRFDKVRVNLVVTPNPVSRDVKAAFEAGKFNAIQLLDNAGRVLQQQNIRPNETLIMMSVSKYAAGTYYLKMLGKDGTVTIRQFIKANR